MESNKSITNNNIYFFTYENIVLIYRKYPDFLYERHLFSRPYSNSYYYHIGFKIYFINPRNPKHFITDITNTPEEIEVNKRRNKASKEALKIPKSTKNINSDLLNLYRPKGYDNKQFINKNPLPGTLSYEQFLKVYEVVPDIYFLDYLFSNQKETYIQVYNLIYIIDPINKDEFITKTSITSFNLPKNNNTSKDYYIYQFTSDIERRTVSLYINRSEYYKLMYYFNEDQNNRKKYLHKIRYQKTRELLIKIQELEKKLEVRIKHKKESKPINQKIQYRMKIIDKLLKKNGIATTKDIQIEYKKRIKKITINPNILDTIENDMKRYINYTKNVKLFGGRGRNNMFRLEYIERWYIFGNVFGLKKHYGYWFIMKNNIVIFNY